MNIIIVGCGQVGQTLAEQLNKEGNNVTVVDTSVEKVKIITDKIDIMGIVGNGASHSTLIEAGISKADLLIAVTGSDELNLLCCIIAKKVGDCRTIARVRSHEYSKDAEYLKTELGLAMVINPEHAAAEEVARILRFPSAINIDTFGKGRIELLTFRLPEDSRIVDMSVREVASRYKSEVLFACVERGDEAHIVKGDFVFQAKDAISIIATPSNAIDFFKKIGYKTQAVKNAIIVGAGETTHYLASMFKPKELSIKVIDKNRKLCEGMSREFPHLTVINGDYQDQETLREEGVETAAAFITLADHDEENILMSLFGRSKSSGKVITKINRLDYDDVIRRLDLDTVVYPKNLISDRIIRYVRATANTKGSNIETLYNVIKGKVEATEFVIRNDSRIAGKTIEKLKLKPDVLIGAILRDGVVLIPRGQDTIEVGDSVIVVTKAMSLKSVNDVLE